MVDDIGLNRIKVRLGLALAGGARPRRIKLVRVLSLQKTKGNPNLPVRVLFGGRYRTRTYDLPHVKRML